MKNAIVLMAIIGIVWSCSNDDSGRASQPFAPGEVSVGIKSGTNISEVFEFINRFDHTVDKINSLTFTSGFPPDSLPYVLDFLNEKSYTNDGINRFVTGYPHHATNEITIFPKLFQMHHREYQNDWLMSMDILRLKDKHIVELNSGVLLFYVPEGQERVWENRFENYDVVDWAELNYIADIELTNN